MIILCELEADGMVHSPVNIGLIRTICRAFPDETVLLFASASHLEATAGQIPPSEVPNLRPQAIRIPAMDAGPWRRFLPDIRHLGAWLAQVGDDEDCLLVLLSANTSSMFAVALLLALSRRRRLGVHLTLHSDLAQVAGWRSANPLIRWQDYVSALLACRRDRARYLVLEPAVGDELEQALPALAGRVDALPHPVDPAEADRAGETRPPPPVRIGFLGLATRQKGIDLFLQLARTCKDRLDGGVAFHIVGRLADKVGEADLSGLASPPSSDRLDREDYLRGLTALHYICLPYQGRQYRFSASGVLLDAVAWRKPVIALRVPIVEDLFRHYGDIGYLCDDVDEMFDAVTSIERSFDPDRYDRQVTALTAIRDARLPRSLAARYRDVVGAGFPGLLAGGRMAGRGAEPDPQAQGR